MNDCKTTLDGKCLERLSIQSFEPSDRRESLERREELPNSLDAMRLSLAWFKHLGPEDHVMCTYCGGNLHNWRKQDNPLYEHLKNFPFCPSVQNLQRQLGITSRCLRLNSQDPETQFRSTLGVDGYRLASRTSDFATGFNPSSNTIMDPQRFDAKMDPNAPRVEVRVSRCEVSARLDLPHVRHMIDELGFNETAVQHVIRRRLQKTGDDFASGEELALAVMIYERKQNPQPAGQGAAGNLHPGEQEAAGNPHLEGLEAEENPHPEGQEAAGHPLPEGQVEWHPQPAVQEAAGHLYPAAGAG